MIQDYESENSKFAIRNSKFALLLGQVFLVTLLTSGVVCAQETTGGGSTADFRRPENPPVHRKPIPSEAAGGRLEGLAGPKSSAPLSKPPGVSNTAGIDPGAARPARSQPRTTSAPNTAAGARPSATPKPANVGSLGGIRSGTGASQPTSRPTTAPSPSAPPIAANSPEPLESEGLEEAIEKGNYARDRKPPNYAEAERLYKLAAKLASDDERGFIGLGNIYYDQNRDEEGIAAYRKAVELQPKNRSVWDAMGDLYFRLGRYEESIEATTQLGLHTAKPGPFWTLVWASLCIGKGEDAGNFANGFVDRWKPFMEGDTPYYIVFGGYLGFREAGLKEKADELLRQPGASSECPDQNWHCRLLKYLRHEVTAQQLLAEANTNDKMTEARTYIGIDLALSGRRAEALPHLRWVVEGGNRQFVEYPLAKAWVTKLGK
ncbi:MAG: tetratricopeptide repeat protein [Pyrinomonadaceae bacterium]